MFEYFAHAATRHAIEQAIILFALVAARLVPIVQLVPHLGGKATPQIVKMGLAFALTLLVYPAVWLSGAVEHLPSSTIQIALLVGKEVLVGLTLGFVASLVFESVRMAGQIIDNARGQTMATTLVPQLPARVSVSANFLYQLAIVVFFLVGGHRLFVEALVRSYVVIPPWVVPGSHGQWHAVALLVARLTADAITLAVLLAFPVMAAILLTNIFLALVNKAAPQINVFFLGMPLKALMGVAVLMLALELVIELFAKKSLENVQSLFDILHILGSSA